MTAPAQGTMHIADAIRILRLFPKPIGLRVSNLRVDAQGLVSVDDIAASITQVGPPLRLEGGSSSG